MPTLCSLLVHAEDKKGSPLTEQEVLSIRDKSVCIMMDAADAAKMEASRGYRDIDPDNCWFDWLVLRKSMGKDDGLAPTPAFKQVDSKDPKYQRTVQSAQRSLDTFRKFMKQDAVDCLFKVYIKKKSFGGYLWLDQPKEEQSVFSGRIFEVPPSWKGYSAGQRLESPAREIQDWMVLDNGTLHGGFSLRYMREGMPEEKRAGYDAFLGVKEYAPLPSK